MNSISPISERGQKKETIFRNGQLVDIESVVLEIGAAWRGGMALRSGFIDDHWVMPVLLLLEEYY